MTGDRKKILALFGLGLIWSGLFARQWMTVSEPTRVPLTNVTGVTSVTRSLRVAGGGLKAKLTRLAAERPRREMPFTAPRNIFAPPHIESQPIGSTSQEAPDLSAHEAARQQAVLAALA